MILDVCAEKMPSRFSHDFGRVCQELAKNLPSHTTPVSIAALLRPRDVRPDLPVFFWEGSGSGSGGMRGAFKFT